MIGKIIHDAKASKKINLGLILTGVFIILMDLLYHFKYLNPLFSEGLPIFLNAYIVENLTILIAVFLIAHGLVKAVNSPLHLFGNNNFRFDKHWTIFNLIISVIFLLLFIFQPSLFSRWSLEDQLIEWLSALILFMCSLIFLVAGFKYRKSITSSKMNLWVFYFLSFTFFVLGMEEISWFQRILESKTPDYLLFSYNSRGEINLHNLATDYVENLYYFGSFIFLVFLPFIRFVFSDFFDRYQWSLFIPRPYISVIGSLFCAYNFDMWNVVFTQYALFGSIIILIFYTYLNERKNEKFLLISTISIIIVSQAMFLLKGSNFDRLWEVTEYKEFLIPLAFMIYGMNLLSMVIKMKKPSLA